MKLVSVTKSDRQGKKWKALFSNPKKTTHFGQTGADDYTITKDKEQRERYRERHKKDLKTNDPSKAGFLSMGILWGDSTSLNKNIAEYKKKYNL
jgi:hypothetical protein